MFSPDPLQTTQLEERLQSGAKWFFWIAGLSIITSLVALSGSNWGFVLSLGITQIIDGIVLNFGPDVSTSAKGIALFLDLMVVGVFVLFGFLAGKRHLWAFVLGMVLFGLDTLLLLLVEDWLGIAFHAYALYGISAGYRAGRKLLQVQTEAKAFSENGPEPEAAV